MAPVSDDSLYNEQYAKKFMIPSFDSLNRIEQQHRLGEFLFPYIAKKIGDKHAPKVTGMIIDLPTADCLIEVNSLKRLNDKWDEAISVLKDNGMID